MKPETQEQISDLLLWSDESAQNIMKEVAAEQGVSVEALAELVAWQREQQERTRRRGMNDVFDDVFNNKAYWS